MSSLCKGRANCLCIVPVLVYVLPKLYWGSHFSYHVFKIQKQLFFFSWMWRLSLSLWFLIFFQFFFLLHNLLLQCFFPSLFIWLSFMLAAFLRCLMMLGCSYLTKILVRSPESWAGCWLQTSEPGGSAGQFVLQHWASGSLGISFGADCPVDLLSGAKEGGLSRVSVFRKLSLYCLVLIDSSVFNSAWFPAVHRTLRKIKSQMSAGLGVDRAAIHAAEARRFGLQRRLK